MMLCKYVSGALLLALGVAGAATTPDTGARYVVGETERLIHPHHVRHWRGAKTQALLTEIWYPVDPAESEAPHNIGPPDNPIFHGHPIAAHAPVSRARERYPLIVLSHGTGGSADSLDWLAAALAAAGYIVAGVNHPGNNALEPLTREGFTLWWERAMDVTDVLDALLADESLGSRLDGKRIGMVGFSLGGYTALELAGARTNRQAFEEFCRSPAADAICHPPEMDQSKDLEAAPLSSSPATLASFARAGASYRDQRVKAAFVIAPALGEAFDAAALADIDIPVMLVGGSADTTVPVETNIKRVAAFLPKANLKLLPGAAHYTFLDSCLPSVAKQLPALCSDPPGVDREAIHAQTVELALAFFDTKLAAARTWRDAPSAPPAKTSRETVPRTGADR